jgi:hypothetical protein
MQHKGVSDSLDWDGIEREKAAPMTKIMNE